MESELSENKSENLSTLDELASDYLERWRKLYESRLDFATHKCTRVFKIDDESAIKVTLDLLVKDKPSGMIPAIKISPKNRKLSLLSLEKGIKEVTFENKFQSFTRAIVLAPEKTPELSLAYEKRSIIFSNTRLFEDCLSDIKQALENENCLDELKANLYLQRAKCLKILKGKYDPEFKKALKEADKWKQVLIFFGRKYFQETRDSILETASERSKIKLSKQEEKRETFVRKLQETPYPKWDYKKYTPSLSSKMNPKIPGLSSSVKMKYSSNYGRHIVADKNINPGETIAVVNPYVKMHSEKMEYRFCHFCSEQTWSSLPCPACNVVIFCSETCRDQANNEYHNFECEILQSIKDFKMKRENFIIAKLIVKGFKESHSSIDELFETVRKIDALEPMKKGFNTDKIFDSNTFASVYSLTGHPLLQHPKKVSLYFDSILLAYLFASKTNILGNKYNSLWVLKEMIKFRKLVGLVQRLIEINSINNMPINIYDNKLKLDNFYSGIFSSLSFFNHSCNPSVVKSVQGSFVIVTAINPIKKGKQIFMSYGPRYNTMTLKQRSKELMNKHFFKCYCKACKKNWPLYKGEPPMFPGGESAEELFLQIDIINEEFKNAELSLRTFGSFANNIPEDIFDSIETCGKLVEKTQQKFGKNSAEYLYVVSVFENFLEKWNCPNAILDYSYPIPKKKNVLPALSVPGELFKNT